MNLPVSSMTTAEKLEAMEQLWASLQTEQELPPPAWHRQILEERTKRIKGGDMTFSTLDEVREWLEKRNP